MDILVSGETKELTLVDAETGLDKTSEFLGSFDALRYDSSGKPTLLDGEFNWWQNVFLHYSEADIAVTQYRSTLNSLDDQTFRTIMEYVTAENIEDQPDAMLRAIDFHKARRATGIRGS